MGRRMLRISSQMLADAIVTALQPLNLQLQPGLPTDVVVLGCRIDIISTFIELELKSETWDDEHDGEPLFTHAVKGSTENGDPVTILTVREQKRK